MMGGPITGLREGRVGDPGRTQLGCSGTFSYGRTEGPGWKDRGQRGARWWPNCECQAKGCSMSHEILVTFSGKGGMP